ncbi:MAG TPA: hypothetical protein PK765_02790 [bacterium]|nr:hypothetical protein [bacterium]
MCFLHDRTFVPVVPSEYDQRIRAMLAAFERKFPESGAVMRDLRER